MLAHLSIRSRLFLLIGIATLALVILALIGVRTARIGETGLENALKEQLPSVDSLMSIRNDLSLLRLHNCEAAALKHDAQTGRQAAELLAQKRMVWKNLDEFYKKYDTIPRDAEEDSLWRRFLDEWKTFKAVDAQFDEIITKLSHATSQNDQEAASTQIAQLIAQSRSNIERTMANLDQLDALNDKKAQEESAATEQAMERSMHWGEGIGLLAIVAVLTLGWLILRSIMDSIQALQRVMVAIEQDKDFTRRVDITGQDEIAETASAFNALMSKLQAAFAEVQRHAEQMSSSALSVASTSEEVASSTAHQNDSASSMAAAVEEMTVSIGQITESAHQGLEVSQRSGEISKQGAEVIERAVGEMTKIAHSIQNSAQRINELGQQSEKISAVVQVIREVADQTNLLALNAAIEAARAGEQGRGFAVVADEVRKLAERTARSTEEISQVISGIQNSSRNAVQTTQQAADQVRGVESLARDASAIITEIKRSVVTVESAMRQISAALSEQSVANRDVARHVESVAQMTDKNSTAVTEFARVSRQLQSLSEAIMTAVRQFRV
ncbi:methyl-accepting chemotaxis protein [Gammaproteobacteria bacterium]